MIPKFSVGTCVEMHGSYYKIVKIQNGCYEIEQQVTVFEEERKYSELWKISYIDKEAKATKQQWKVCK